MNNRKAIIFIASDRRSGSTLLDHLLSNHTEIVTVGELEGLQSYLNFVNKSTPAARHWLCRCGKSLAECPFWSKVIACYKKARSAINILPYKQSPGNFNVKGTLYVQNMFTGKLISGSGTEDISLDVNRLPH